MLKEVYLLIIQGTFDREPIEFESYPSQEEIKKCLQSLEGKTARIEKRYKLVES